MQTKPSAMEYGSDTSGLVWGYLFMPEQTPQPIECAAALEWLKRPAEARSGGFLWLHFSLANTGAERWMRSSLELADGFYDSLHEGVGSTRLEIDDQALVAVIHDVIFNSTFDAANISTAALCMEPHLVVSARLRPLRSLDQLRASIKAGETLRSAPELLAALLRDQAAVLADIARQSTLRVDRIEDDMLADRVALSRSELSKLRRSLVRLQRLLAPEPAALFRLLSRPPRWLNEDDVTDLRQAAEEFSAAVIDSVALTERLKLLQEELAAIINEHTNRTLFLLTLVTVLALPINLVAGIFGMNVGGLPLAQHPHGFFLVVSGLTVVTVGLAYFFVLRRRE